ncbi:MAG TPA: TolC family protein [Vicinamibacterales bacterium]
MSKTAFISAIAAIALALAVPVAAQQKTKATDAPSDDRVKELIAQAQATLQQPISGQPPAAQGPRVDLTADDAVARALEKNVTLASQRLTPRLSDYQIAATWATYRPSLTSTYVSNSATQLPNTTIEGGDVVHNDTANWNAGITQNLRWYGGSYNLQWTNDRQNTDRFNSTFNPVFNSGFRAQFNQPLIQNFKIDQTRANLQTQAIQRDIAELDLQATIASTTAQVRNAYWELAYAQLNLEAQRASFDLASRLVNDNKQRVEIGTMAPIDVVQAQAEQATRRQAVVNAEATLKNNELALKRLIVSGTDDPVWNATLNAVDKPSAIADSFDLEVAVRNALANRTDLATAKKNIDSANVTLKSFSNQSLPSLNLQATYSLAGRGGTALLRNRDTNEILETFPGGYSDALAALRGWEFPTWNVQMQFTYPLGTSQAEANKARQQLVIQQNQATVKATELQVATEVTAAAIAIRNSQEAIAAATAARELSEQRYNAAQSKLDVGMATNFEVVQAQRDLADARNRELRELLNLRRALVDFQRVQISPR